jgi:hypothetical protein
MATVRSVVDMPLKSSKAAPEKFKGHHDDVRDFVEHYEKLLAINNVTADEEKCKAIRTYCSRSVKEVIESMPGYLSCDWDSLKNDLLKYYNADKSDQRFSEKDLTRFARSHREKDIRSIYEFRKYMRRYIRIAGWLRSKEKISDREYNKNLWKGLPRSLKRKLEARITSKKPGVNLADPFNAEDVIEAAEYVLKPDRFDGSSSESLSENDSDDERKTSKKGKLRKKKLTKGKMVKQRNVQRYRADKDLSGKESDTSSSASESASIYDDSESDSEEERAVAKRGAKKRVRFPKSGKSARTRAPLTRAEVQEMEENLEDEQAAASKYDEVEGLIARMARMGLDDPQYAALYYRATKLDEKVREQLMAPVHRNAPQITATRPSRAPTPPPSTARSSINAGVATYPNSIPLARGPAIGAASVCFGCGKTGHRVNDCEEIRKLEGNGVIRRDENGRYVLTDGGRIHRAMGEPIASAVERMLPKVNYVEAENRVLATVAEPSTDEASEEDQDESRVYISQRSERPVTKGARKEVFDGVYLRPAKKPASTEQKGTEPEKPPRSTRPAPQSRKQTQKARNEGTAAMPREVPVEIRNPDFDPANDDAIMEDVSKSAESRKPGLSTKVGTERKKTLTNAKVVEMADIEGLYKRILGAQIPISIGELAGVSKDVRNHLLEALKAKRAVVPGSAGVLYQAPSGNRPQLKYNHIRVEIKYKDHSFRGLIDTGAQMNIIGPKMYEVIRSDIPIDTSEALMMRDINGGQGQLLGAVLNVPIDLGAARTFANFYVSPNEMDFEILLGRPWQRHNYVSILERPESGTWLTFLYPDLLVNNVPKEIMLNVSPARGKSRRRQTSTMEITDKDWESMHLLRQLLHRERVLANALGNDNGGATIEEVETAEVYTAMTERADSPPAHQASDRASSSTCKILLTHPPAEPTPLEPTQLGILGRARPVNASPDGNLRTLAECAEAVSIIRAAQETRRWPVIQLIENSGQMSQETLEPRPRIGEELRVQVSRNISNRERLLSKAKRTEPQEGRRSNAEEENQVSDQGISGGKEAVSSDEGEQARTSKLESYQTALSPASRREIRAETREGWVQESRNAVGRLRTKPYEASSRDTALTPPLQDAERLRMLAGNQSQNPHDTGELDGELQHLKPEHRATHHSINIMSSQGTTRVPSPEARSDTASFRDEDLDAVTMTSLYAEELQLRGDEVVMIEHGWDHFGEYFQFQCHNASLVLPRAVLEYLTGRGRIDYGHAVIRWYPTPPSTFEGLHNAPVPFHFDHLFPPFTQILNADALNMVMRPEPTPTRAVSPRNEGPNAHLGGLVLPATFKDEDVSVSLRSVPGRRDFEFLMPADCIPAHLGDLQVRGPATYYPPHTPPLPTLDPRRRPTISSLIEPPADSILFVRASSPVPLQHARSEIYADQPVINMAEPEESEDKRAQEAAGLAEINARIEEARREVARLREHMRTTGDAYEAACEVLGTFSAHDFIETGSLTPNQARDPLDIAREIMSQLSTANDKAYEDWSASARLFRVLLRRRAELEENEARIARSRETALDAQRAPTANAALTIDPALLLQPSTPDEFRRKHLAQLAEKIAHAEQAVENSKVRLRKANQEFDNAIKALEQAQPTPREYYETLMGYADEEERALEECKTAILQVYGLYEERRVWLSTADIEDSNTHQDMETDEKDKDAEGDTDTEDNGVGIGICSRCGHTHGAVPCPTNTASRIDEASPRARAARIYAASALSDGTSDDEDDAMDTEDDEDEIEIYDSTIAFTSVANERYVLVEHPHARRTFTSTLGSERYTIPSENPGARGDAVEQIRNQETTRRFGRADNANALAVDPQVFVPHTPPGLRRTYSLPPIEAIADPTPPATPSPQTTPSEASSGSRNRAKTFEDRVIEKLNQLQENIENTQVSISVFHRITRDEQQRLDTRLEEVKTVIKYLLTATKTLIQGVEQVDRRVAHGVHDIVDHYLSSWDEDLFGGIGHESFQTGRCIDPEKTMVMPFARGG